MLSGLSSVDIVVSDLHFVMDWGWKREKKGWFGLYTKLCIAYGHDVVHVCTLEMIRR